MDGGFFEAYWGQAMRFLKEMKRLIDAETIRIDVNHGRSPVEIATLRGMDASDVRVWALQNMDLIWSPITDRWLPRAGDNEPATQRLEEFACRQNLLADVHPSSQNHKISNDKPSQTEINLALTKQAALDLLRDAWLVEVINEGAGGDADADATRRCADFVRSVAEKVLLS